MASFKFPSMLKIVICMGLTTFLMDCEVGGAPRGTGWNEWRDVRQAGGGSSLTSILTQARVHERSRQKLLQGLSGSQQQQLASDLTQLIRTLNEPSFSKLREEVRVLVSQPMTREVALDVLSRLNGQFREFPWWKNINMLSIEKIW